MRTGLTNDRVFAAAYDSVAQGDLVAHWSVAEVPGTDGHGIAAARLRLETLLTETLVVSDTQVLDGAVLRGLARRGRLAGLGRSPGGALPVEVRARAQTLEQSLWAMYVDEDREVVRGFLPSSFRNGEVLRERLQAYGAPPQQRGLAGVVTVLRDVGVHPADLADAEEGWRRLFELERGLSVVRWRGTLADHLDEAAQRDHLETLRDDLGTSRARDLLTAVGRMRYDRVTAHAAIARLEQDGDEDEVREAGLVRHWYDQVYMRAQAFQHQADFRSVEDGRFSAGSFDKLQESADGRVQRVAVELPAGCLTYLAGVDDDEWAGFCLLHRARLRSWWHSGEVDALRGVLDELARHADARLGARPAGAGRRTKGLSSGRLARFLMRAGKEGGLAMAPSTGGLSLGLSVALVLWETAGEQRAGGPSVPTVEVTDYADEPTA